MIWLILLVLLMCAALVACVFEGAIRAEVYPPGAADAPGLDCGCPESPVVIGCMVCDRTSCPTHRSHDHADPVDEVHDGWQRSKYFTGEEAAQLEAAAQPAVPIVASDHPSDCGDACCWEIRLTEMHDSFDWHAAEHEMRSKR